MRQYILVVILITFGIWALKRLDVFKSYAVIDQSVYTRKHIRLNCTNYRSWVDLMNGPIREFYANGILTSYSCCDNICLQEQHYSALMAVYRYANDIDRLCAAADTERQSSLKIPESSKAGSLDDHDSQPDNLEALERAVLVATSMKEDSLSRLPAGMRQFVYELRNGINLEVLSITRGELQEADPFSQFVEAWRIDPRTIAFAESLGLDITRLEALKAIVLATQQQGLIITTFATMSYLPVLQNWLVSLERVGVPLEQVLLFCLDQDLYDYFEGRSSFSRFNMLPSKIATNILHDTWIRRSFYTALVLSLGVAIIQSDVDAVWTRNPIQEFYGAPYDLLLSKGKFPKPQGRLWGATGCMGWTWWRPTVGTMQLMIAMGKFMQEEKPDDQVAINTIIDRIYSPQWSISSEDLRAQQCPLWSSIEIDIEPLEKYTSYANPRLADEKLKIALLPYTLIRRNCDSATGEEFIMHCLTAKDAARKKVQLQAHHLWYLE